MKTELIVTYEQPLLSSTVNLLSWMAWPSANLEPVIERKPCPAVGWRTSQLALPRTLTEDYRYASHERSCGFQSSHAERGVHHEAQVRHGQPCRYEHEVGGHRGTHYVLLCRSTCVFALLETAVPPPTADSRPVEISESRTCLGSVGVAPRRGLKGMLETCPLMLNETEQEQEPGPHQEDGANSALYPPMQ